MRFVSHGIMGWSAVCDCGIPCLYPLTIYLQKRLNARIYFVGGSVHFLSKYSLFLRTYEQEHEISVLITSASGVVSDKHVQACQIHT